MSKEIKNYFEVKEICRKATSYFIGSFIEYIIDRREEWENPQTKKTFIANFHKEFFEWDDECTFERTQNRVNCAIRLIEHHKVEEALEYVLNSNDKNVLGAALSIIDKHIHLNHKEIARKIYAETNYCDQDYNKFIAVITSGELTLREYIRKRRLFFAASELVNSPDKAIVDISLEYGYSGQTAFARAIKREFGKTPVEIRKSKESLPDVRKVLENYLANKSRLDSIIAKLEGDNLSNTDWHYFEDFIHATDELGFDTATCCLISELSEKLSIPFAHLIEQCFEMAIQYDENKDEEISEIIDVMSELQIESQDELDDLCQHYDCKWYDLTFAMVKMYQLGIDSEEELSRIWNYYDCKWMMGDPYPITRQMVQDYHQKHE